MNGDVFGFVKNNKLYAIIFMHKGDIHKIQKNIAIVLNSFKSIA